MKPEIKKYLQKLASKNGDNTSGMNSCFVEYQISMADKDTTFLIKGVPADEDTPQEEEQTLELTLDIIQQALEQLDNSTLIQLIGDRLPEIIQEVMEEEDAN